MTKAKRTMPKLPKPATLISRDRVKSEYARSLKEHYINKFSNCRDADARSVACNCIHLANSSFLRAVEEYVDSTWKNLTHAQRIATAKSQQPAESIGMRGLYYMPFDDGSKFHPVCGNTFCHLLGCRGQQFMELKQALTNRDWRISDELMEEVKLAASAASSRTNASAMESNPTGLGIVAGGCGDDKDEDKGAERAASTGRAPRQNAPKSNLLEIIQMLKSDDESSDEEDFV